jgi:hypothetical protein
MVVNESNSTHMHEVAAIVTRQGWAHHKTKGSPLRIIAGVVCSCTRGALPPTSCHCRQTPEVPREEKPNHNGDLSFSSVTDEDDASLNHRSFAFPNEWNRHVLVIWSDTLEKRPESISDQIPKHLSNVLVVGMAYEHFAYCAALYP